MFVSDLALVGLFGCCCILARVACCISLLGLALFLLSWVVVCSCYYLFVLFASLVETVGESAILPVGSSRYRLPKSCLLAGCGPPGRLADATLRREECYGTTSSCPRVVDPVGFGYPTSAVVSYRRCSAPSSTPSTQPLALRTSRIG